MKYFFIIIILTFVSCNSKRENKGTASIQSGSLKYTKFFCIKQYNGYKEIFYLNPENSNDTTGKIILVSDSNLFKNDNNVIRIPVRSVIALSSVFIGFLDDLGETNSVKGIDNINYICNTFLRKQFEEGIVKETGEEGQLNMEKVALINPDVLFGSLFGSSAEKEAKNLSKYGIPMAVCNNYLEQDPLARAEWIKFFAAFYNKEVLADSLFSIVEQQYLAIKAQATKNIVHPTVMTDVKFGDAWNVPGGSSYTANLIQDAGGKYIFINKNKSYNYPLSMEILLNEALDSDIWINCGNFKTMDEIMLSDKRYTFFKPYKEKRIFNYIKQLNHYGGNSFWESAPGHPEKVLHDLSIIFNDKNKSQSDNLIYYTHLK
ncbi:MAG: ABC transporter substrate-binding protein [Bacteroidia bacterium]|nr:ABC transporter substrate-binding protein [Bacteroidia bacterium]